jgi:hypothetical protein
MKAATGLWLPILLLTMPSVAGWADQQRVKPEKTTWSVEPVFSFPAADKPVKVRQSLSGIACPADLKPPRRCVAVFDEGVEVRYVVVDGQRLLAEPDRIVLLPGGEEIDAEGAAREGDFVFVTGSHAPKRGPPPCKVNADSRHVFRFAVDPATGRTRLNAEGVPVSRASDDGRLWRLLTQHHVLSGFVRDDKCLGKAGGHAANIEGLAAKDGNLFFGFRGPANDKATYVLRVSANALFTGGDLADKLFAVKLDKGRGIRDLLAVSDGFLILIGPDDDSADVGWSIAFWDGSGGDDAVTAPVVPKMMANLDLREVSLSSCDKELKPEAIAMLEDGSDFRRVLVLSDGMCDGGPMSFRIMK